MIENAVIPIKKIRPHPENPNVHPDEQVRQLEASYTEFGQFNSIIVWAQEDGSYVQVGRHGFLQGAIKQGAKDIRADILPADTDPLTIKRIMIADNRLALGSVMDEEILARLMEESVDAGYALEALGSNQEEYRQLLAQVRDKLDGLHDDIERPSKQLPNKRQLPLDIIYTLKGADCTCCLAVQAGLKYGIQSGGYRLCPYTHELSGRHEVCFVDNDYFNYDHDVHLATVREFRPKYATVKDIMTEGQCLADNIEWTSLEQTLDWAEELREYAQEVIVIPKYDCIDDIPDHFILGYSIPTSHGGTPLPLSPFQGRRVHLLGGSWQAQLSYMAELGEDVVSVDNNQILLLATKFGQFVHPDGETMSLSEIGLGALTNPRYAALTLSFGSIAAKVHELCEKESV